MSGINIRFAKTDELRACWELDFQNLVDGWKMHPATGAPPTRTWLRQRHREALERYYKPDHGHRLLAAFDQGKAVGTVWYGPVYDHLFVKDVGVIFSVFVLPTHRKRGIATRLLREAHKRMDKQGLDYTRLWVFPNNDAALALYRKLGYDTEMHQLFRQSTSKDGQLSD